MGNSYPSSKKIAAILRQQHLLDEERYALCQKMFEKRSPRRGRLRFVPYIRSVIVFFLAIYLYLIAPFIHIGMVNYYVCGVLVGMIVIIFELFTNKFWNRYSPNRIFYIYNLGAVTTGMITEITQLTSRSSITLTYHFTVGAQEFIGKGVYFAIVLNITNKAFSINDIKINDKVIVFYNEIDPGDNECLLPSLEDIKKRRIVRNDYIARSSFS